jgi:signal transduction histidine kinase
MLTSVAWAHAASEAELVREVGAAELLTADGQWRPVSLPLRWRAGQAHGVRLRFDIEIEREPQTMWAFRFERLPPDHDLQINGQRAHGQPVGAGKALPRSVLSHWIEVPPGVWRAGTNRVELSVDLYGFPGGISAPRVGPAAEVQAGHRVARLWRETLPYALNMGVSGLAMFMLLAWWLRRDERLMGLFGGLMLLVALRNMGYYTEDGVLPTPVGSLLYFCAVVLTTTLMVGLAIALDIEPRRRRRSAWLIRATVIAFLVALAAAITGQLPALRAFGYPVLMLCMLAAMWRLSRLAFRESANAGRQMVAATALIVVFSVHDYLFLAMRLSLDDFFWLPYLTPALMSAAALAMLKRFVEALTLLERHAHDLEHRVEERTRDLQEANAAKSRFVAAASHDLRQPVASIGLLTSLLREPLSEQTSRHVMNRLTDSVVALENLLKGLLDLSRFDARLVAAIPRTVPLQVLFDAVASHEREAAHQKGLSLRLRSANLAVRADPALLEQIVRNLVSNAIQYTQQGGVLLCARRTRFGEVLIQVWDTGVGIPEALHDTVFEEFVHVQSSARGPRRGLGLGLALVKRAAQLMGVTVVLRSVPGRGSCFSLRLPEVDGAAASLAGVSPPEAAGFNGRCIWVVDDDEGVRESLKLRLTGWGASVQTFDCVRALGDALGGGASEPQPDLLISDHRLPDGDSHAVVEQWVQFHPGVPVLVITADTAPSELVRLDALGWPRLHKPFGTDALCAAVMSALRHAGQADTSA